MAKVKIIRQRSNFHEKLSPEQKNIFRRTVHEMMHDCSKKHNLDEENPVFPTVRLLHQRLMTIRGFPRCSKTTVHNILAFMGFKVLGNHDIDSAMLIEDDFIVNWRKNYIKKIRQLRAEGYLIFYLDESYMNANDIPKVLVFTAI